MQKLSYDEMKENEQLCEWSPNSCFFDDVVEVPKAV